MPNQLTGDEAIVGDIKVLTGGQVQKVLTGSVARTDTTAKTLGVIPAGATIFGLTINGAAVSNAGTSATVTFGYAGGTGHELPNTFYVKGATGAGQQTPSAATLGTTLSSAQTVTGIYAESGTASTSGGPWQVVVEFVTSTS